MQAQRGSKIGMGIHNLLDLYLEFLDRNVSALVVHCNKSLLGMRVFKRVIVPSTKEDEMSLLFHSQVSSPWTGFQA